MGTATEEETAAARAALAAKNLARRDVIEQGVTVLQAVVEALYTAKGRKLARQIVAALKRAEEEEAAEPISDAAAYWDHLCAKQDARERDYARQVALIAKHKKLDAAEGLPWRCPCPVCDYDRNRKKGPIRRHRMGATGEWIPPRKRGRSR